MNNDDKIPVGNAEDLTGKIFGNLTVLYRVKHTGTTSGAKWKCQCDCGKYKDVLASNLKKGHTLSCGCLQKKRTGDSHLINEVGNQYGRLKVIERGENRFTPSGGSRVTWKCQCDCGNIVEVNGESLRRGLTTSCGCYRLEQVSNRSNDKYIGKTYHYIQILNKSNKKLDSGEGLWNCKCLLCNKDFVLPTSKLTTQISCGCIKDSYGVSIIKSLLLNNNILFETEKIFKNCILSSGKNARFDFYVNNEYIIEFDGQQHYTFSGGWNTEEQVKATQKRDIEKNLWCHKNNIPIIRIPYWEVENLLLEDLQINSRFLLMGDLEDEA